MNEPGVPNLKSATTKFGDQQEEKALEQKASRQGKERQDG